jgi:hypothetical protein
MKKHPRTECVIIHDVDLLPANDLNIYDCGESHNPRHLSVRIDKYNYTRLSEQWTGGVLAITPHAFIKANGYSNSLLSSTASGKC